MKQEGAKIAGSIGPNADSRHEVTKGAIEGSRVTLEAVVADQELRVTLRLKLQPLERMEAHHWTMQIAEPKAD